MKKHVFNLCLVFFVWLVAIYLLDPVFYFIEPHRIPPIYNPGYSTAIFLFIVIIFYPLSSKIDLFNFLKSNNNRIMSFLCLTISLVTILSEIIKMSDDLRLVDRLAAEGAILHGTHNVTLWHVVSLFIAPLFCSFIFYKRINASDQKRISIAFVITCILCLVSLIIIPFNIDYIFTFHPTVKLSYLLNIICILLLLSPLIGNLRKAKP